MRRGFHLFRTGAQKLSISIFESSSDFIWKSEEDKVVIAEVYSLDDEFVVLFIENPCKENCINTKLPHIYVPIMIGKLAGKVKYPI